MAGLTARDAEVLGRCLQVGGWAVVPTDTVYGLACDPDAKEALQTIYLLKRRPMTKPSAVLFFSLESAQDSLPELDPATRGAMERLLPGGVTLLVPNPARRFPLAAGTEGTGEVLGVRVPSLGDALAPLRAVRWPILQTSANLSGGPDPRTVQDVPAVLRESADLVLDGGPLPGTSSTVVDLSTWAQDGRWRIVRHGAVPEAAVADALSTA